MKFYYLTSLFLGLSIASQAQQGWSVSDKVMIGHSWTVGNRSENMKYAFHPTVQFGRTALYNFSDNVGIGLGTFFSSEGARFKVTSSSEEGKAEQRMNYVRIPLGAMFTLGDAAMRVRPRIGLGGSVGFLVGGKTYLINDNNNFAGAKTTRVMGTKIDAGANASLGFSVKVTDGFHINHDINYYHGLVENQYDDANLPSFTQRNIGLSMGFTITGDAMKKWKGKMKGMHHQ